MTDQLRDSIPTLTDAELTALQSKAEVRFHVIGCSDAQYWEGIAAACFCELDRRKESGWTPGHTEAINNLGDMLLGEA